MQETNTDFVIRMYQNHLGREPDSEGMSAWVFHLDNGVRKEDVERCFENCSEANQ